MVSGHCKCGSQLVCHILPRGENDNIVKISCSASAGDGLCGKRQCRGETRQQVVNELQGKSTEIYRAKVAAANMQEGDSTEPPHLYNSAVLWTAKHQDFQSKYREPNAMVALSKFKRCHEGQQVVRDICLDPVGVLFWSPHQIRLYNNLVKRDDARLCIDATGGVAKYVKHVDNNKSKHIFLYIAVLYCSIGRITVSASFSECQDTVSTLG